LENQFKSAADPDFLYSTDTIVVLTIMKTILMTFSVFLALQQTL